MGAACWSLLVCSVELLRTGGERYAGYLRLCFVFARLIFPRVRFVGFGLGAERTFR